MGNFEPYAPVENPRQVAALEAFGRWVWESRRRLGLSQAAFGYRVGLSQSTISRLERGLMPYLTFQRAVRLLTVMIDALATR